MENLDAAVQRLAAIGAREDLLIGLAGEWKAYWRRRAEYDAVCAAMVVEVVRGLGACVAGLDRDVTEVEVVAWPPASDFSRMLSHRDEAFLDMGLLPPAMRLRTAALPFALRIARRDSDDGGFRIMIGW